MTLERYHEMALALSTVGMAHRGITGDMRVMVDCYRHAAQCAQWDGDVALAEFLADAGSRLEQELAAGACSDVERQSPSSKGTTAPASSRFPKVKSSLSLVPA